MALFSGNIETAYYINEDYSLIEIVYTDENGDLTNHMIEADTGHPDYKDLVAEGYDEEKLFIETAEHKRKYSRAFNMQVHDAAKVLLEEKFGFKDDSVAPEEKEDSFTWTQFFTTMNEDKSELFKFKIWAFESERMKDATSDQKKTLRKAKTLIDAINVYDSQF